MSREREACWGIFRAIGIDSVCDSAYTGSIAVRAFVNGEAKMHLKRIRRNHGLSLVELLVVVGVIAILATITVPMLGMFYENDTDLMARELFTLIRAAQVYATTHNVHAAVGFGFSMRTDSLSGEPVPIIDSYIIARSLKRDELMHLGLPHSGARLMVPLAGRDGAFQKFGHEACILLNESFQEMVVGFEEIPDVLVGDGLDEPGIYGDDADEISTNDGQPEIIEVTRVVSSIGLSEVRILGNDRVGVMSVSNSVELPDILREIWPDSLPGLVFTPEGSLLPDPLLPKQRMHIQIGEYPDADPGDRFLMDNSTEQPSLDENGNKIILGTVIDIWRPTGRVRIQK